MATPHEGALIAVIADEDTITGFLLAGVGHMDVRKVGGWVLRACVRVWVECPH